MKENKSKENNKEKTSRRSALHLLETYSDEDGKSINQPTNQINRLPTSIAAAATTAETALSLPPFLISRFPSTLVYGTYDQAVLISDTFSPPLPP